MNDADYLPCAKRKRLVMYGADGVKTPVQQCQSKESQKYSLPVLQADCEACPVRMQVSKRVESQTQYKPPPLNTLNHVTGTRPDANAPDPWLPCVDRKVVSFNACCGEVAETRMCDSNECFRKGAEVNAAICQACIYRRSPESSQTNSESA